MSILKVQSTIQGKLTLLHDKESFEVHDRHKIVCEFGIERAKVRYSSISAKRPTTFGTFPVKGYINSVLYTWLN